MSAISFTSNYSLNCLTNGLKSVSQHKQETPLGILGSNSQKVNSENKNEGAYVLDLSSASKNVIEVPTNNMTSRFGLRQQEYLKARETEKAWEKWNSDVTSHFQLEKGAEELEGHEIFRYFAEKWDTKTDTIDEYGYAISMPAYKKENPDQPNDKPLAEMWTYSGSSMCIDGVNYEDEDAIRAFFEKQSHLVPKAEPEMQSRDAVALKGLTLEERKFFLERVQKLMDENEIEIFSDKKVTALDLGYSGSHSKLQENKVDIDGINIYFKGLWIGCDPKSKDYANQQYDFGSCSPSSNSQGLNEIKKLGQLIAADTQLMDLIKKSSDAHDAQSALGSPKQTHEYTISILDNTGKRLPDDQIYVRSGNGNRQIKMSVKEFTQLDRKQITEMLLKG
ncbi:MAG: hypothetical protein ACRC2T_18875 [Thermoguttaceae bacterium]